jgi:hypothetical protein
LKSARERLRSNSVAVGGEDGRAECNGPAVDAAACSGAPLSGKRHERVGVIPLRKQASVDEQELRVGASLHRAPPDLRVGVRLADEVGQLRMRQQNELVVLDATRDALEKCVRAAAQIEDRAHAGQHLEGTRVVVLEDD